MLGRDPALQLIVWVTAAGRDAVVSSYAQALRDVGVRAPGANPEQAAGQFLAHASQPTSVAKSNSLGLRSGRSVGWVLKPIKMRGVARDRERGGRRGERSRRGTTGIRAGHGDGNRGGHHDRGRAGSGAA